MKNKTIPGRWIVIAIVVVSAIVISICAIMLFAHPRGKIAPPPSIAVMPLKGDDNGAVAAQIENALRRIPDFRVAPGPNGKFADSQKIGEALNVRTLLEGSVAGSQVTLKLINASDGFEFWSHTYAATEIQTELPRAVAQTLQLKLN